MYMEIEKWITALKELYPTLNQVKFSWGAPGGFGVALPLRGSNDYACDYDARAKSGDILHVFFCFVLYAVHTYIYLKLYEYVAKHKRTDHMEKNIPYVLRCKNREL